MSLPEVGQAAPDFSLPEYALGGAHRLGETTAHAPTLVAFFKRSCVTSRLTLPFIERLHQQYASMQVLGISQDDSSDTAAFVKETGLTFPVLLDSDWKVSTAYDLFTVPTIFLLDEAGIVRRVNMGWNKEHISALAGDIATLLGATPVPLISDADKVPAFKPG